MGAAEELPALIDVSVVCAFFCCCWFLLQWLFKTFGKNIKIYDCKEKLYTHIISNIIRNLVLETSFQI